MRGKQTQTRKRKAYLTKQALIRATHKATRSVSSEAMSIKGYVVKAEDGWVVKIHNSGRRERLSRLNRSNSVVLD